MIYQFYSHAPMDIIEIDVVIWTEVPLLDLVSNVLAMETKKNAFWEETDKSRAIAEKDGQDDTVNLKVRSRNNP